MLITLAEARAKGLKHYFTGKCCPKGHVAQRFTSTLACVDCARAASAKWKCDNLEAEKTRQATYYYKNRERRIANARTWREANSEHKKEYTAKHYRDNKERILEAGRKRRAANRDKVAALAAAKRAEKDMRTPKWLTKQDFADIRKFYALANELSQAYGFPWHVDHIIPLKGKTVSGLHVVDNLQVIPGSDNRKKSNLFHGC
jgi:hypothetical protein